MSATSDAGVFRAVSLLPVFIARAEHRAELLTELRRLAAASRGDSGCQTYDLYQDADSLDRIVLIERWADQHALDAHNAQPHVQRFLDGTRHLLEAPFDVTRLLPVD